MKLCPGLPHNAAWAAARREAALHSPRSSITAPSRRTPNLRSPADCVRLLCLPTPRDVTYFDDHRRVGRRCAGFLWPPVTPRKSSAAISSGSSSAGRPCRLAPTCLPKHFPAAANAVMLGLAWRSTASLRSCAGQGGGKRRRTKEAEEKAAAAEQISSDAGEGIPSNHLVVVRYEQEEMKNPKLKDILGP